MMTILASRGERHDRAGAAPSLQHGLYGLVPAMWILVSCASTSTGPPATRQPDWHDIDSGVGCAPARVACDSTRCIAEVDNRCGVPVTCRLAMQALCEAHTGESGPATARSGPQTIAAGRKASVVAELICDASEARLTQPSTLRCFR
jgi:hypothetical protein